MTDLEDSADKEMPQPAIANDPMARLMRGDEIDPTTLTDEELAAMFPNFAAVWADVIKRLMEREQLNTDLKDGDQTS